MKSFNFHINKLSARQLRQARAWALACMLLVICAESILGYVLCCFYTNHGRFSQAYTTSNTRLAKMQQTAKNQMASLLDFTRIPAKKASVHGPFTMSFNLFIDQYRMDLPTCLAREIKANNLFEYNQLYYFTYTTDILRPPRQFQAFRFNFF